MVEAVADDKSVLQAPWNASWEVRGLAREARSTLEGVFLEGDLLLHRAEVLRLGEQDRAALERFWSSRPQNPGTLEAAIALPPNRCVELYRSRRHEQVAEELIDRAEAALAALRRK